MDELYTVNLLEFQIVRQKLIWGWLSCRAGLLATMFIVATTRSHIIELVLDMYTTKNTVHIWPFGVK